MMERYGTNPGETNRRKNRPDHVTPDQHFRLERRVAVIEHNMINMTNTQTQLVSEARNLREHVTGILESYSVDAHKLVSEVNRLLTGRTWREYVLAGLIFTAVITQLATWALLTYMWPG